MINESNMMLKGTFKDLVSFYEMVDEYTFDKSEFESICATVGIDHNGEYYGALENFADQKKIINKARKKGVKIYEYNGYFFINMKWLVENFAHKLGKSKKHTQLLKQ